MEVAECRHGLDPATCGFCQPRSQASHNVGSTRRPSGSERTKQELMNAVSDHLGVARVRTSRGSTDPKGFWDSVAVAVGIQPRSTKIATARAIAEAAGLPWPAGADSSDTQSGGGGTVTATGLTVVLNAVRDLRP